MKRNPRLVRWSTPTGARPGTSPRQETDIETEFHWDDWDEASPAPPPAGDDAQRRPGPGVAADFVPAPRRPSPPEPPPADAGLVRETAAGTLDELRSVIQHTWGYDSLRPLQAEAMEAALAGRDALVVLPTGGGKSLCYQAPAILRPGLTAVVSPLISLMQDQIDGLAASGVPAAMLTSAQDGLERGRVRGLLGEGRLKLLFVAPERLMAEGFLAELFEYGLSALAVDEAHCISHWGHDFRPEYRMLGELRRRRPDVPIQAFTATATPTVQRDIVTELDLRDPAVLVGSCDRPNLTYRFLPRGDLHAQVLQVVRRHPGDAGIVYCIRRKDVDKLARELAGDGVRCVPYHAGLDPAERARNQDRFLSEDVDVVVATVAFGMGIDRTDVRYVVHAALPKGLEQYSQETGRAGRDGLPAECVLFSTGSDYHAWKNLMERAAAEAGRGADSGGSDLDGQLDRLGEMMGFATGAVCRHKVLVEHFGQRLPDPEGDEGCGACDVCLGELRVLPDADAVARSVLRAVLECEERYGAQHVADVLRGADTERIRRAGHSRLEAHGALPGRTTREVRGWIDQLLGRGLLATASGQYPTLFLTAEGREALAGDRPVVLLETPQPVRSSSRRAAPAAVAAEEGAPPVDEALFEHLRGVRRRLARERGVPPYLVFSDRTLALMAAHRPSTPAEFLALKGVGDKKAADLGPIFLAALEEYAGRSS